VTSQIELPTDLSRPFRAAWKAALTRATSDLKELVLLLGAMAALPVAYYAFQEKVKLPEPWPAIICGVFFLIFVLMFLLPAIQDQMRFQYLRNAGIRGHLVDPKYFRLTPFETNEAKSFHRADSAADDICRWIEASSQPILYLSGQSGVGKSSLINAAIVPYMTATKWVVASLRPYDSPSEEIAGALLRPSVVWRNPPTAPLASRHVIEQAAERVRRDGKRLLLVIDQFEEGLILSGGEIKAAFLALLCDLTARPVLGIKVLLSLRAEYLNDLPELGLPPPAYGPGQNTFEVRPFTRAAAQAFIQKSGLELAPGLLDKVLEEASEIEDMPDRVRPIVLNMFGLVVASFMGSLPKEVRAGALLSGYVERSMKSRATQGFAPDVLRPLLTDAGTKRTLTTEQIAEQAGVTPLVARGCLIPLTNDGLVRYLQGTPEKWEVAHDFVARLLQPLLRSWRKSVWQHSRRFLIPVPLGVLLLATVGLTVFYPTLHDEYILVKLRTVGLVPGPSKEGQAVFVYNGTPISVTAELWKAASRLNDLNQRVVGLIISQSLMSGLQGMPALPDLASLDLSFNQEITSLQGMPALPALASLNLKSCRITSLQGMPALPALASLNLSSNRRITSLQGMPALPALVSLNLSGTGITSLQGMPALPALVSLDLSGTGITSLQGMPALPALAWLNLTGTGITSLQGMPALPALASLDLSSNRITSLQGMPALPALASLNLSFNQEITSLQGMPALPALASLYLSFNQKITSLQGMPALPALASLDLHFNQKITSLQGMPALPALASLNLSSTGITSLQGMPALPLLTTIDLADSAITDLRDFPNHSRIQKIIISPGQINPENIPIDIEDKIEIHR
jgi:hypothetical protein